MDLNSIKEWLVALSTVGTLITLSTGVWLSLHEYRLKLRAERRLSQSNQVEMDIQLIKLFTEIMNIAHARGGYHVSEKAIERILTPELLQIFDSKNIPINHILNDNAVLRLPVGEAAQDAAIAAIGTLGKRHEMLYSIAERALQSLLSFKGKVAAPILRDLQINHHIKKRETEPIPDSYSTVLAVYSGLYQLMLGDESIKALISTGHAPDPAAVLRASTLAECAELLGQPLIIRSNVNFATTSRGEIEAGTLIKMESVYKNLREQMSDLLEGYGISEEAFLQWVQ